jgi:hypothetical protein
VGVGEMRSRRVADARGSHDTTARMCLKIYVIYLQGVVVRRGSCEVQRGKYLVVVGAVGGPGEVIVGG